MKNKHLEVKILEESMKESVENMEKSIEDMKKSIQDMDKSIKKSIEDIDINLDNAEEDLNFGDNEEYISPNFIRNHGSISTNFTDIKCERISPNFSNNPECISPNILDNIEYISDGVEDLQFDPTLTVTTVITLVDETEIQSMIEPLKQTVEQDISEITSMVQQDSTETKKKIWKRIPGFGLFLIVIATLIAGFTNVIIKKFDNIDPAVLLFYRSVTVFSISMPWAVCKDKSPFPPLQPRKDRLLLLFRGVTGCLSMWANYYSLQHMPLGDQKMMVATKPMFVTISARLFLKEPCGVFEVINIVMMAVGVLFVMKPPFVFGVEEEDMYDTETLKSAIALFVTTALAANITIILRQLRKEHVASLTASNQIIFLIESFFFVMIFGKELFTPSWQDRLKILLIALSSMATSLLFLLALKLEEANVVSLFSSSMGIILAFLLQIFIFEELPDWITCVGAGLVTLAVLMIGVNKLIKKNKDYFKHNLTFMSSKCDSPINA